MKKGTLVFVCLLGIVVLMLCGMAGAVAEKEGVNASDYISRYMSLYDYNLPGQVTEKLCTDFSPAEAICGPIHIKFEQILYDGQWLFAAASAYTDLSDILIMPGSAEYGDLIVGSNGENPQFDDTRTFVQVATEEDKNLIAVYVYIKEFDNCGAYFLDHFQEPQGVSALLSGARIGAGNQEIAVQWTVQLYNVDTATGKYSYLNEYLFPMKIQPMQPYLETMIELVDPAEAPFDHILLVQSALTTYILPQWKNKADQADYQVTLLNDSGTPLAQGAPPTMDSYSLESLSNDLQVCVVNLRSGVSKTYSLRMP